ncbi:MAG: ABC transporter substrate-binding protein [Chloroflexi bacterium]|nr:ABC transporter substrate-binding protein [Chloroflexota bacterium]
MKSRSLWPILLAIAIVLSGLAACAPAVTPSGAEPAQATQPPEVAQAEPLRLAIAADESTLTPYSYVFGYPGYHLMKLIYDSLLELDADNIPQPWLAERMEVSPDGKVYSFTLREGVTWHDGEPFTAEDVQFTYEYFVAHPQQSRFARTAKQVASVEAVDDRTVVMTLAQPDPSFSLRLADVPILPKHIWSQVDDPQNFAGRVGTGPYRLVEYVPEQFYRLEANPDYFMGRPAVPEIVLPIIVEQTTMFSALKSGEVDAVSRQIPPELVAEFEGVPSIRVVRGPGFATTLLQFNDERPPLDQPVVRRAIALAIDRQALVDTLLLGFGTVGNPGFVHPSSPYANPDIELAYDPDGARALLDEAGFLDGDGDGIRETPDGQAMSFDLLVYSNNPQRVRAAELIRDWVREIGIALEVKALDPKTVDSLVWPGFDVSQGRDFDLSMWGWSASVQIDPSRLVDLLHSDPAVGALNIGGYRSQAFDALAEKLAGTLDPDERMAIIKDMQAIIAQDVPFVTLYYADGIYAYRPAAYDGYVYVKGLGIVNKLSFIAR